MKGPAAPQSLIFIQRPPEIWETKTPTTENFDLISEIATSNFVDPSNIKESVLKEQYFIKLFFYIFFLFCSARPQSKRDSCYE